MDKKSREELVQDVLNEAEPDVIIKLVSVDNEDLNGEGKSGLAIAVEFKDGAPPESVEDATVVQMVAMLMLEKFQEVMVSISGEHVASGGSQEVLSSLASKNKQAEETLDEIEKTLKDLGINTTTSKEVH